MSAIIWQKDLTDRPPADFESQLCAKLANRVEAGYLFGSYGTPEFHPGSDIDLILVTQTDLPFVERPRLFNDLYQLYGRLDLLVYLPGELDALLQETTGFWASVKASLRELPIGEDRPRRL